MKSLFEREAFNEIKSRVNGLTLEAEQQWGKMTVGQMVHHCQGPLNIILGKKDYGLKPNWFVKTFFKKSLYNDKLWKTGLPTAPVFKETKDWDFETEKANLDALLDEFESQRERENWKPHPMFGNLTKQQWGQMQYKHLDHHLRQFNS